MFLLDTNVVSELRKVHSGRADANVASWAHAQTVDDFFLSALTLMELEIGVLQLERRDPTQGGRLRQWLDDQVKPEFKERVLPITESVAVRCAQLHVPNPRSERDALIAATAIESSLTVVTRNVSDFEQTGVLIVNPWESS